MNKEQFFTLALALNLVAVGVGLGSYTTWTQVRVANAEARVQQIEQAQANVLKELNEKILPTIEKKLADAGATKKGG